MLPLIYAAALLMCILYSFVMRLQQDLGPGAHTLIYAAAEGESLALYLTTPQKSSVRLEPAPHSSTGEHCHAAALHLSAPREGITKLLHQIASLNRCARMPVPCSDMRHRRGLWG